MRSRVLVYGTVQGVGFRWFVQHHARALDLAGFVLNRADGSVEIEADGPTDAVTDLLHTVQNGPPGATVTQVQSLPPTELELQRPFRIHH